jgi:CubicO group peptidase (beta-lactamase class C family)
MWMEDSRMRVLLSLLLLSFGPALRAAELPPLGDQTTAWAKSLGHGAVAAAGKRGGRWTFAIAGQPFAAGHADVPAERVLFEIGSITKVFTGILLADAVKAGKLGLDDTLAQRLPVKFDQPATGAVTLKQLATHTSCLPRLPGNMTNATLDDPYGQYDDKALFEYLAHAKLDGQPPCESAYSNLGFGILGVVLERVYGKPWAKLVQEKITGPLGMVDTVQELSPAQQSRFAEPWAGEKRAHPWTFKAIAGAGALRSTLADMSKLADALLAGPKGPLGNVWPLLAGDFVDMRAVGGKIGLALIHTKDSGQDSYSHDGETGGFGSILYVRPASGLAVIVLASNAAANPRQWLAAWEAAGRPPVTRSEIALPAAVLDEYVGVYPLDKSTRFTLLRRGDGLVARLTGQSFLPLFASAKDELFYKAVDARISFHRNASGQVDGLTLHQSGRDIQAPRAADPAPHIEFPNAAALKEYLGDYDFSQFQPGAKVTVTATGDQLLAMLTGQPAFPVFCVGKDRFEYDVVVAALTFERDKAGKIVAVVLHQNGLEMRAPRNSP